MPFTKSKEITFPVATSGVIAYFFNCHDANNTESYRLKIEVTDANGTSTLVDVTKQDQHVDRKPFTNATKLKIEVTSDVETHARGPFPFAAGGGAVVRFDSQADGTLDKIWTTPVGVIAHTS